MTDKKGNNIKPPSTKTTESTENADGVKPAYFRKSETVRGNNSDISETVDPRADCIQNHTGNNIILSNDNQRENLHPPANTGNYQ